jgi:16S rRNA (guanine527-N7)-methyltransferase
MCVGVAGPERLPHEMFHVKHSAMSPAECADLVGLDQNTLARLEVYLTLLEKWQAKINLVGSGTLADPWRRHFLDSAQLRRQISASVKSMADLGSGAGFPGLVLAILGAPDMHLIESDQRKAAFLREAARITETPVSIHAARIETLTLRVDCVTARALAPLERLLDWAVPVLNIDGFALFLKGRNCDDELTQARKNWMMEVERIPSLADPEGIILKLGAIHRGRSDFRPRA